MPGWTSGVHSEFNHRKIAVLDGTTGYTGSLNIHDAGFALDAGRWQQRMVGLEGPVVRQLQLLFVEDWSFVADEHLVDPELFPPSSYQVAKLLSPLM